MYFSDEDGHPHSPQAEEYYASLARGGVGTIVMEQCFVRKSGAFAKGQLGLSEDSHISDHTRLVSAMRMASPACILICQLSHAAEFTKTGVPGLAVDSATPQQLGDVVSAFASAAVRAFRAGYDGVQLHAGHSFLLSSFLSPARNHRTDEFGPVTLERPSRLLDMVIDRVHETLTAAGASDRFLVGVKLQTDEFQGDKPGMTPALAASVAKHIAPRVSFIEISGGVPPEDQRKELGPQRPGTGRFYYRDVVKVFREAGIMDLTTVAVTGGLRSKADFEEALEAGAAIVGASRPFLRNINFVRDLEEGKEGPLCIGCGQCHKPVEVVGRSGCIFVDVQ